jgi:putative ABC transport system permease protein
VTIDSGSAPAGNGVLTDKHNAGAKSFDARAGGEARVVAADGRAQSLPIIGVGRKLTGGQDDPSNDWITLYATPETVATLSGTPGYTSLGLRLRDASRPAAERTVAAVRDQLRATTAFTAFDDMPVINEPGGYPGKADFEGIAGVLGVITLLALLSALVLVSNTMTTLIGEQTGEIAAMKAIGARRRDIRRIYLRTALMLGALGALFGAALGVLLANALVGFFASAFFYVEAGFGVSVPAIVASVAAGLVGPALAALPAIRRATRLPLNEALQASGSALGGQGRLDAALRRVRFLPRDAQIGLRGLGRRKRRSFATALQISVAVATLLSLLSLGAGLAQTGRAHFDDNHFDIWIQAVASKPLGTEAGRLIASTDGVRAAQPWMQNNVRLEGRDAQAWGLPARPLMNTRVEKGRWYTDAEVSAGAKVVVLGATVAKTTGKAVGDRVEISSGSGPATLRVIGISGFQANNGDVAFTPVSTLQSVLGSPGTVNSYWITTTSDDHGLIDRTTTRVEDALAARGNQVGSFVMYDVKEKTIAANAQITTATTILGLVIVAISLVALINTITMAVLERTREIGTLRSVGARARNIRRIFATEGLVVAVTGWLLGVPLGYVLARMIGWAAGDATGLDIAFVFPLGYVAMALVGTVVLALAVMLAPLRRAVRYKPGDALRYA